MDEIWKKIPGLSLVFEASNLGRIRRHETSGIDHRGDGRGGTIWRTYKPRILRCSKLSPNGYMRHRIDGETWFLHRLIAWAFVPNPENFPQVNHKNGVKTDNRAENLEWVSNQQNRDHAVAMGLTVKGSTAGGAKLIEADVIKIRDLCANGAMQKDMAAQFGICQQTVSNILARKTWRHI